MGYTLTIPKNPTEFTRQRGMFPKNPTVYFGLVENKLEGEMTGKNSAKKKDLSPTPLPTIDICGDCEFILYLLLLFDRFFQILL